MTLENRWRIHVIFVKGSNIFHSSRGTQTTPVLPVSETVIIMYINNYFSHCPALCFSVFFISFDLLIVLHFINNNIYETWSQKWETKIHLGGKMKIWNRDECTSIAPGLWYWNISNEKQQEVKKRTERMCWCFFWNWFLCVCQWMLLM